LVLHQSAGQTAQPVPLFAGPLSYAYAYGLSMSRPAKLALADGTVFDGHGFGASGEVFGEVVFNTSMTGYQEILTDPSYAGQIVTMTYPLIGNYGINPEDVESGGLSLRGLLCGKTAGTRVIIDR
jgi:carbamoylphosphate synthase small subunit